MRATAIKEEFDELVPEFGNGESVYLDFNGECDGKKYIIKKSQFQPLTTVFMYSFENTSMCCSENYLKRRRNDKPRKITEVMHDRKGARRGIVEEGWSFKKDQISMEGIRNFAANLDLLFFRPDRAMVEWLVKYANGRLMVEVGCGACAVLYRLAEAGGKVLGIEPNLDIENWMSLNQKRMAKGQGGVINVMPKPIEECGSMITQLGTKAMYLFTRPCHSDFVENGIDLLPQGCEVLYITLPENWDKYDDLGKYREQARIIKHDGNSADGEVIYTITK